MKLVVILCLISLVLLVKCDEEAASDDDGDFDASEEDYHTDDEDAIVDKEDPLLDERDSIPDAEDFDTDEDEYIFEETEFGTGEDFGGDGVEDEDEDESSLKCIVCKAVIEVMRHEIEKVDTRKRIQVSSTKSVQYSKSESYLAELMEDLCEFEDTFGTIRQVLVQKTIIRKMLKNNGAVEEASDYTSGSILNENINHLCLEVLEENEDIIMKEFMKEVTLDNIEDIVCTQTAQYCNDDHTSRDEL